MDKVFIGGSRRITSLNPDVRNHLDRIMERQLPVLVGDANGADKAVQKYLADFDYDNVEVFCSNGVCRNNVGHWKTRAVAVSKGTRGFDFYAAKDREMAAEATVGFMLWDGKSKGTLLQMRRLVTQGKKVLVYTSHLKRLSTLNNETDFEDFADECSADRRKVAKIMAAYSTETPSSEKEAQLSF